MRIPHWPALVCGWVLAAMAVQTALAQRPADALSGAVTQADAIDESDADDDASEAGGITEWRRAAGMCMVHGIELAHHEEPQIAVHMLAAVPNGTYVECFPDPERDPLWAGFIKNRAAIRDGIIEVPQGSGFGLELDWQQIERYRLDR